MRYLTTALALTVLCGCSQETKVTAPGDQLADLRPPNLRYHITKLPTLDGAGTSQGGGINNLGWVAGYSPTTTGARHAALWRDGVITDLLTLGGHHSNVQWPGINNNGMVVGISHTANLDPYNEDWSCSAFIPKTGEICRGFFWENDVMTELPTLGGTNGFAAGVNNRGQVVGWAENTVQDPTCVHPQQIFQFRAVLWDPRNGTKQELPPYSNDATSAATAINDHGQVVGISGECDVAVGRKSATHALLWDHGTVTNLPTLGGDFWHTPMAINDRGDIVGFGNPPGGDLNGDNLHVFLWTQAEGITDLQPLPDDGSSQAFDINTRGQIVGVSCGDLCTAILWQNGVRFKLKDLVEPATADHLWSARSINDAGVITGRLYEAGTGKPLAYIATPIAAPSAVASRAP